MRMRRRLPRRWPRRAPTSTFTSTPRRAFRYDVWFRAQAERNQYTNDSFYMQFSDAVDAAGKSQARIGTTAGLAMVLEEGSGAGLSGWGWNDANYGGPASPVYFASSVTAHAAPAGA